MFGKKIRLTDDEIDRIAEAVVNKIILKQREIDEAYFNTTIDWKNTGDNSYDGEKLKLLLHDESGKWERRNAPNQIDQQQLSYEMILQNLVGLEILLNEYVKKEKGL